ncbi:rRNA maturation RNase YbeY [Mycoplasmatota bacterium zrk1]
MKTININYFNKTNSSTESYEKLGDFIMNIASNIMKINKQKEISFIFLNNPEMQEMNKTYRDKNYPTDVLTFIGDDDYLGDIFISIDKVKEQALEFDHSFEKELSFMFIHGFLHSLGYDHETEEEYKEMFEIQDKIMEAVYE